MDIINMIFKYSFLILGSIMILIRLILMILPYLAKRDGVELPFTKKDKRDAIVGILLGALALTLGINIG